MLARELDKPVYGSHYRRDSTTVLRHIRNEKKRFQVFVANWVQMIQDATNPHQWRYVKSKRNPADDTSHGLEGDYPVIILLKKSFIVEATVYDAHKKVVNPGRGITLNELGSSSQTQLWDISFPSVLFAIVSKEQLVNRRWSICQRRG